MTKPEEQARTVEVKGDELPAVARQYVEVTADGFLNFLHSREYVKFYLTRLSPPREVDKNYMFREIVAMVTMTPTAFVDLYGAMSPVVEALRPIVEATRNAAR
jgi:hypothetical protein